MSALRNVLKGKHVCISCRKIIFETYQSALYNCNPECLHFSFPKSRSHTALTLPHSSGKNAPWDQLSMCLRNCTFWSKSALRIGHGWMVLAALKMTVSKPRRFYNADPGSSSPSRPLGRGGVRACVLRPASFPSCRVHSFLHSYWCYNTSFWKCRRLKWIFLCFQLLSSV